MVPIGYISHLLLHGVQLGPYNDKWDLGAWDPCQKIPRGMVTAPLKDF